MRQKDGVKLRQESSHYIGGLCVNYNYLGMAQLIGLNLYFCFLATSREVKNGFAMWYRSKYMLLFKAQDLNLLADGLKAMGQATKLTIRTELSNLPIVPIEVAD